MTDEERAEFVKQWSSLVDQESSESTSFDKAILTISAGAIALTLTYVQNVAQHPLPETRYMLELSLLFLIGSMLATVLSFRTSILAIRKQRDIIYDYYSKPTSDAPKESIQTRITNLLNWLSMALLVLGVSYLALFCTANLKFGGADEQAAESKRNSAAQANTTTTIYNYQASAKTGKVCSKKISSAKPHAKESSHPDPARRIKVEGS